MQHLEITVIDDPDFSYNFIKKLGKKTKMLSVSSINGLNKNILSHIEGLHVDELDIKELEYISTFKNIKAVECANLYGYDKNDNQLTVDINKFNFDRIYIEDTDGVETFLIQLRTKYVELDEHINDSMNINKLYLKANKNGIINSYIQLKDGQICKIQLTHNSDNLLHSFDDKPALIIFNRDGTPKTIQYYTDGIINRAGNKPTVIESNSDLVTEQYYVDGILRQEKIFKNKLLLSEKVYDNKYDINLKKLFKDNVIMCPSCGAHLKDNECEKCGYWYLNNVARQVINGDVTIDNKYDIVTDFVLPDNLSPAITKDVLYSYVAEQATTNHMYRYSTYVKTEYYPNGKNIMKESYYKFRSLHRDGDNPAVIEYYENGEKKKESYHKYGLFERANDQPNILEYAKDFTQNDYEIWTNETGNELRRNELNIAGMLTKAAKDDI